MKRHALILLSLAVLTSLCAWWPQSDVMQVLSLEQKHLAAGVSASDLMRIRISSWDAREMANRSLELQLENDVWVLPQHYNYPADASERVGELAGILLGLRLGVSISSEIALYKECRLYDPTDSQHTQQYQNGFGTRVQMWDAKNEIIVDIIVGSQVDKDASKHYVRLRDEQSIFTIPWALDLPLRFVDWVDRAVAKIDATTIKSIHLNQYRMQMQDGKLKRRRGIRVSFHRDNVDGLWNSKSADPGKKTNDAAVQGLMKSVIAGTFQGVRPFSSDPKELAKYGIHFGARGIQGEKGELSLVAQDGITYNVFLGSSLRTDEKRELSDSMDYRYALLVCSYDFEADRVRPNELIDAKIKAGKKAAAALNKRFAKYVYIIDDLTYRSMHPRIPTLYMDKPQEQ